MTPHASPGISGKTGILVRTDLLGILIWFPNRPHVSIDDSKPAEMDYAEFFPVEPGWHTVRCFIYPPSFPRVRRFGDSSVKVLVPRGSVVSLRWNAPKTFVPGHFKILHTE